MISIGGHRSKEGSLGLEVYRSERNGQSVIVKRAFTEEDRAGIINEATMLRALEGEGYTPKLLEITDHEIIEEDLGESQSVTDGELFRRECIGLLWALRRNNIQHGDLTGVNIIIKDDRPYAIDFQQSRFFINPPADKRKLSDSYYLWRFAQQPSKLHPSPDTPRVMRRWLAVQGALGGNSLDPYILANKTLLDLGCYRGDFCAMAAAAGMVATGIDTGGFDSAENSIDWAQKNWPPDMPVVFAKKNIMEVEDFRYDAVLLFSTWAYIVQDYGLTMATDLLRRIVEQAGTLFFETQLAGDGPGPQALVTHDDVANMLGQFGIVQHLTTIPVVGRPAERSVWSVRKHV